MTFLRYSFYTLRIECNPGDSSAFSTIGNPDDSFKSKFLMIFFVKPISAAACVAPIAFNR